MLIQAQIKVKNEEWEEATEMLEKAYKLPGVKDNLFDKPELLKDSKKYNLPFGQEERCKIFVLLSQVYSNQKKYE